MAELDLGTLYDFNKEAMKNEKPLDPIELHNKVKTIAEEMYDSEEHDEHYWMLLCHDRRDYTLFNIIAAESYSVIVDELKPTLVNRGYVLSVDKQPDNAWEIWIRDIETEENFAYYLFQYDKGVIEIND